MTIKHSLKILQRACNVAKRRGYKNLLFATLTLNEEYIISNQYYQLVFDRNFAKAFWGELDHYKGQINCFSLPQWVWKIRKMAICEDPLEFLEEEITRESAKLPDVPETTSISLVGEDPESEQVDEDFPLPEMLD